MKLQKVAKQLTLGQFAEKTANKSNKTALNELESVEYAKNIVATQIQ